MVVEHSDNVIDRALHLLQGEANAIAVGVGNLVHRAIRMYDTWSVYRDGSLHRHAILVAVDRDGVLDGFLGSPDNHLVRCAVDSYTCTGATGWELAWLRNSRLRVELARGVGHNTYGEPAWPNDLLYMFPICIWANTLFGHNLATWTTHETAQRQEVSSCTQGFNGPSVFLAHSSISARKDGHYEWLYL